MSRPNPTIPSGLRLIRGGRPETAPASASLPRPPAPEFCAPELAAELAELFAMSLLRDTPFDALGDPHTTIRPDGGPGFTLHEMLCEWRNLSWSDSDSVAAIIPRQDGPLSRAELGESSHRRSLKWNGDGQLTLRSAFRSGVASADGGPRVSPLLLRDIQASQPELDAERPLSGAPLSDWLRWCARSSGAGLQLPSARNSAVSNRLETPTEMADYILETPPARAFHNAVLSNLSRGVGFDRGLTATHSDQTDWTASRLFDLLAEAETRARAVALQRGAQSDRLSRPAVTAARLSVYLAREDRQIGPEGTSLANAAEELASAAPSLLEWMGRANGVLRKDLSLRTNLFLPLLGPEQMPPHPADLAPLVVIAGALATLMKAVFDTSEAAPVRLQGATQPAPGLAEDLDLLAANMAMARSVLASHYPAENHQDLRIGQTIALHLLRDRLEADNRSACLTFTDFDGQHIRLSAHPRAFGRGFAEYHVNGQPFAWPQHDNRPAAHLTAVV